MSARRRRLMRLGALGWSPSALFESDTDGAVLRSGYQDAVYQDAAGTTEGADGQPMGLLLDSRYQLQGEVDGLVASPAGFDWLPPVSITRSGSTYSTDFNANDWVISNSLSMWVATDGNDSTGDGSQDFPYASFGKCFSVGAGAAQDTLTIFAKPGVYDRRYKWGLNPPDKNMNVLSIGGDAILSCRYEPQTWTEHSAGVYTTTRSAVGHIRDERFPDADGISPLLPTTGTLAECESTPGTSFIDGSDVYVHRQDDSIPDSSLLLLGNLASAYFKEDRSYYVSGIVFEGGTIGAAYLPTTATTTARAVFNRVDFRYSGGNGLRVVGTPTVICNSCEAYANDQDGFNYHIGSNGVSPNVVEISCNGYRNGLSDENDNGSTAHEDCRIVRVNGEYYRNLGPNIADVGTSLSWNMGCDSYESLGSSTADVAYLSADTVSMWLDNCTAESEYSLIAAQDSEIIHRGSTLEGSQIGVISTNYVSSFGSHATQRTAGERPTLNSGMLDVDGVDDSMTVALPAIASATVGIAKPTGAEISTSVDLSGGSYTIDEDGYAWVIIDRALSSNETSRLTAWLNTEAGL